MGLIINGVDISYGKAGKSAYDIALENGFIGTEQDFGNSLSQMIEMQMSLGKFNVDCTWNADETVYTKSWTFKDKTYKEILTRVSDTVFKTQLLIDDVSAGTWTTTINESNGSCATVYAAE